MEKSKKYLVGLGVVVLVLIGSLVYNYTRNTEPESPAEVGEIPDLDRALPEVAGMDPRIRADIESRITNVVAALKTNPDDLSGWIELGLQRKALNDYEGARQAWEYANYIRPENSLSFANLGDLYAYYIKDEARAEQNFLKAIQNDPQLTYLYFQTSEFYRYVAKDNRKAKEILEQGKEANPGEAAAFDAALKSL